MLSALLELTTYQNILIYILGGMPCAVIHFQYYKSILAISIWTLLVRIP